MIAQVIIDGILDDIKCQELTSSGSSSELLQVTEISAITYWPKCSSSLLDLAHLFDKISDANSLTRRTQRSIKLVRIFEKIGTDKIKYLIVSRSWSYTVSEKILPEVNIPSTSQITLAKADDNDLTNLKEEDFCDDKICSKLYKRYKKQTENEPWPLTEVCESEVINLKPGKGPITFEVRPSNKPKFAIIA
ncbi:hypothetical protein GLOIN_2v1875377 [Rhizophagus clarus]|uniref:Uncharacterized protein n=1 Tax=Rhizophagus clarus TaxID=94130 RepID=A0A8H3LY81_9GLOM|nr:hypothetical protein GLOIN_2v1875377 [Rhizophagus clarus]